jgi:proteic killer suppression protein
MEFHDEELKRLVVDASFAPAKWDQFVIRAFRKKIQLIDAAEDERDLRATRSLRLEQLQGDRAGTSSIRLNDKMRLILSFRTDDDGRVAVILEVVDYH